MAMTDESREATRAFDYSTLEESKRVRLQLKADAIKTRMKRTAEDIIAIGQDLIEVKQELEHGQFQDWLRSEFGMNLRTAQRFMQVAIRFGEIESDTLAFFPVSVLYELATPSTIDKIVQDVLQGQIPADIQSIKKAKEEHARQKQRDSTYQGGYQALMPPLVTPSRQQAKEAQTLIERAKQNAGILPLIPPGTQPDEEKRRQKILKCSQALTGNTANLYQYLNEVYRDPLRNAGVVGTLEMVKENLLTSLCIIDEILQQHLPPDDEEE